MRRLSSSISPSASGDVRLGSLGRVPRMGDPRRARTIRLSASPGQRQVGVLLMRIPHLYGVSDARCCAALQRRFVSSDCLRSPSCGDGRRWRRVRRPGRRAEWRFPRSGFGVSLRSPSMLEPADRVRGQRARRFQEQRWRCELASRQRGFDGPLRLRPCDRPAPPDPVRRNQQRCPRPPRRAGLARTSMPSISTIALALIRGTRVLYASPVSLLSSVQAGAGELLHPARARFASSRRPRSEATGDRLRGRGRRLVQPPTEAARGE